MSGLGLAVSRERRGARAAWRLLLALAAGPAVAAPADPHLVECAARRSEALVGASADAGTRYRLANDVTVAAPALPAGWTIARCSADEVVFLHADEAKQVVLTAMVSRAAVGPWRDERSFADAVRAMFRRTSGAGAQHLTTDGVRSLRVGGRPCVELQRSGTASEDGQVRDLAVPDPWIAREVARMCHLQDPAHAGAAVLAVVKLTGPHDPGILGAAAQGFLAGVTLPGR